MVIREIMHYCGVSLPSILNWSPEIGAVKAIVEFADIAGRETDGRAQSSVGARFQSRPYLIHVYTCVMSAKEVESPWQARLKFIGGKP
jgi:hypothetical protein